MPDTPGTARSAAWLRITGGAFPIASSVLKVSYPAISRYAVTSDGQKFLVQVGRPDQSRTLHVVFNWPQIVHAAR